MEESALSNGASFAQPHADAILEMLNTKENAGAVCALLTPTMKAKLKELVPGQVLLVRVDDQSARLDVQSWCDLTGNPLQAAYEESGVFSFYIKKKEAQGNG